MNKLIDHVDKLAAFAGILAGCVVFAYSTFATTTYVNQKNDELIRLMEQRSAAQEAMMQRMIAGLEKIEARLWDLRDQKNLKGK